MYFDPWFAGVVLPILIIAGLLAFPYIDANPLGSGYYTIRQRVVAIGSFGAGFLIWLMLIFIGTFVRGPGWMWFWPGQTWDHTRVTYEVNRNLAGAFGIGNVWLAAVVGFASIGLFYWLAGKAIHWLVTRTPLDRNIFERTSRAAVPDFPVLRDHDPYRPAGEDDSASGVSDSIRSGHSLVQHIDAARTSRNARSDHQPFAERPDYGLRPAADSRIVLGTL